MGVSLSPRRRRLLLAAMLLFIAVQSLGRLAQYDPIPWGSMLVFMVGTILLAGPIAWIARDRIPDDRRERLGYLVAGVALLCLPLIIGFGLIFNNLPLVFDAAAFGSVVGIAVVVLAEQTVVPERLRGTSF